MAPLAPYIQLPLGIDALLGCSCNDWVLTQCSGAISIAKAFLLSTPIIMCSSFSDQSNSILGKIHFGYSNDMNETDSNDMNETDSVLLAIKKILYVTVTFVSAPPDV